MLKTVFDKLFVIYVLILVTLQLWLMFQFQLFGDESFYWLEGQYLSLSYTELPGWTAWMTRLGTSIFGNHYFAVRVVSYVGFLSVFLAIFLIHTKINKGTVFQHFTKNILLVLSIPLFVLVSIMALPDIWIIVFVMWILYLFIRSITSDRKTDWLILGVIIACSINVHVRMWIWLFFAGLAFLICFRTNTKVLKAALLVTLPVGLLGLIPIIIFNYQTEFSLFSFQFGQRHPWQFQWQNFSFILSQLIVITPLILLVWLKTVITYKNYYKKQPIIAWIILTALMHFIFYVVMSVFVDGLRTTVHWLLVSYVPVLTIVSVFEKRRKIYTLAIVSGGTVTLLMLFYLGFNKSHSSNLQSRILDNSLGWHELSKVVNRLQNQYKTKHFITDYFMTASELAFELDNKNSIKVLPHDKSIKHGRQKQLKIMNMLLSNPSQFNQEALLIVEDTSLKLQDKGKYYGQLCDYFKNLEFLESLNIKNSKKQFYIFKVNNNQSVQLCQIPPLFYVEKEITENQIEISGWVILHNSNINKLSVLNEGKEYKIENTGLINHGIRPMFPEINDLNTPNNAFKIKMPLTEFEASYFQIMATDNNNKTYYSQNYFID